MAGRLDGFARRPAPPSARSGRRLDVFNSVSPRPATRHPAAKVPCRWPRADPAAMVWGHCGRADPRDAARSGSSGTLIDCSGRQAPLSSNVGGLAPSRRLQMSSSRRPPLVEWLAACRDGKPARPTAEHRFRKWMPAATDWYSTDSLRQPDRRWGAGSELDSRTDQRGRRQMRPGELLTTGGS